jgi:hypothetical protein
MKQKDGNDECSQMTDIYDVPIDVHEIRKFRDGHRLGVGYDLDHPTTFFVYDRNEDDDSWHKHCGPYSTFDQAKDWIRDIREIPRG